MKITIDTNDLSCKVGKKVFGVDMPKAEQDEVEMFIRKFLNKNTHLTDYEEDCAWMSYRYCIGRHTIASHMHAGDIWKNCKGRMSKERELFTAFDINREIEDKMRFGRGPEWRFPLTSYNRIYATAIDIFCQFIEDYGIKSTEDYLKYRKIDVMLSDNEAGYKLEATTWEEWLRPQVHEIVQDGFVEQEITEDKAWEYYLNWKSDKPTMPYFNEAFAEKFKELSKDIPTTKYFWMHDIEDLFVWNDLVHCFDHEHHHKSILIDGSECEWFWSWKHKTEQREDGYYYQTFGYDKIRVPVNDWNGSVTRWIPDESIKKDLI